MRQSRTLVGVMVALAVGAATARGQPLPPHQPPADALAAIYDMKMTRLARKALASDLKLAPLDLRVEVKRGVAVIWGDAPDDTVATAVSKKLKAIDGVTDVRSEIKTVRGPATLSVPNREPPMQLKVAAAKPLAPPTKPPAIKVGGEGKKAVRPGTLPGTRTSERRDTTPPRTDPASGSLEEAVAKIQASEARYKGITVQVRGDAIEITRRGDDQDVASLAQALRRVRGVSEVRMKSE